jgi:transcriptional regulator with XRE-family HTH domain
MTQTRNILNMLGRRRRALAMPYNELQRRSGVSTSTLKRVLRGEVTASFATVASVADSLGVDLGTTHAQDVTAMRERQARVKARKLIALVQGTSALEGQAVDESDRRLMEQKTAAQLLAGSGLKLWGR